MKERIGYLDAFRGLCIFAVIYTHIINFCICDGEYQYKSLINIYLSTVFLTGFFFISGFMAYKPEEWTIRKTWSIIYKKFLTLYVPTIVVGSIFAYSHNSNIVTLLFEEAKIGYWFTYTLFILLTLYYLIMCIVNRIKSNIVRNLFAFAIILLCIFLNHYFHQIRKPIWVLFEMHHVIGYTPYFILGILCRKYETIFHKITDYKFTVWILLAIYVMSFYLLIPLVARCVVAIGMTYCIFRRSSLLKVDKFIDIPVKYLSLVGRNTVEIYFVHYFLLFILPQSLVSYMDFLVFQRGTTFVEFMTIGSIAVCISIMSILISNIVKLIPYGGKVFFGRE